MKKKLSILGSIALCMVVVGTGTCVLALGLGANTSLEIGEISFFEHTLENVKKEETLPAFENIEVALGALDFEIKDSDHYGIQVDLNKRTGVTYEVAGNTLRISQKGYKNLFNFGSLNLGYDLTRQGKLVVLVPKATLLKDITIKESIGSKGIQNITVEQLDLKAGVGDTELENVQIDKVIIRSGVGSITASDISCKDLKIAGGVGDADLQGVFGDVDISGGIGSVKIETSRKDSEYDYHITRGLGDVELNNRSATGFKNVHQENDSDYTMKIRGGVGDIEIYTAE